MKFILAFAIFLGTTKVCQAYLRYHPISFVLSTDKAQYYEGEKITFHLTITNTDATHIYPVLIPNTQNTGPKLLYLNVYDKAKNTLLLRYTENRMLNMMVHDTGTVAIKYLKPHEHVVVPIYLNDFENYFSYHTQNASHHSMGVPLFAGVYQVNLTYNPKGFALGDSIYTYYNDFDKNEAPTSKLTIPENGAVTQMLTLQIKRSSDTIISIEGKKYYIKTDGYMYYYFSEPVQQITTDMRCIHITTLPPDSSALPTGEYFYSHFADLYAEYIARFDDGDIRLYRKFSDYCPDYLYTEEYNTFKQLILYACQLPDRTFYKVTYHQPGGNKHEETYCSADGTLCSVNTYVYNKKGIFVKKQVVQTQPCIEVELNGKKQNVKRVSNLESH